MNTTSIPAIFKRRLRHFKTEFVLAIILTLLAAVFIVEAFVGIPVATQQTQVPTTKLSTTLPNSGTNIAN